ncbi:MAG: hypothetical protein KKD28_02630 [Chloroflexi bacterium]|nr:hypothetical protein [Chloroflexota bacterium]
MTYAPTISPIRYIVEEDGQRTGVVLGWNDYKHLKAMFPVDQDLLLGFNEAELQTLAEGMLSPQYQQQLAELSLRNREDTLNSADQNKFDHLLERIDHLNILKARAKYTIQQLHKENA